MNFSFQEDQPGRFTVTPNKINGPTTYIYYKKQEHVHGAIYAVELQLIDPERKPK